MLRGIFGGRPGRCSKVKLKTSTGDIIYQPAKFSGLRTDIGDVITYYSPVGGAGARWSGSIDDVLDGDHQH